MQDALGMALDQARTLNLAARFLLEHGAVPTTYVLFSVRVGAHVVCCLVLCSWHYHSGVQSFELFRWLVAAGLDVHAPNSDGRKPFLLHLLSFLF